MSKMTLEKYISSTMKACGYTTKIEFHKALLNIMDSLSSEHAVIVKMRFGMTPFDEYHTFDGIADKLSKLTILDPRRIKYIVKRACEKIARR